MKTVKLALNNVLHQLKFPVFWTQAFTSSKLQKAVSAIGLGQNLNCVDTLTLAKNTMADRCQKKLIKNNNTEMKFLKYVNFCYFFNINDVFCCIL